LSRYGGLRVPSEVVRLTWQDVDFEAGRLTINAKKTEHHEDGGVRFCPIFPELRPFLQTLYDQANPGIDCPMSTPVITRWRSGNQNLRTAYEKLLKRAGVKQWPRLFHNQRASRQTELLAEFPIKDVCSWIGNSEAVAMKHYAMAMSDSFERAVGGSISANQQVSAKNNPNRKPPENASSDGSSDPQNPNKLAEAGLERVRNFPANTQFSKAGGAECGAVDATNGKTDSELGCLIECWPQIPSSVKSEILKLARHSPNLMDAEKDRPTDRG